jgi:hypothetical protein
VERHGPHRRRPGFAKLAAVTGYINFKRGFYIDADAAPTADAEFDQNDKVKQFSQEVGLSGETRPRQLDRRRLLFLGPCADVLAGIR